MKPGDRPGAEAIQRKGWFGAHRWLLARRLSQLIILGLFLAGPWLGIWIVKGNLASSLTLEVLPLTDPLLLLQVLASGQMPAATALIGAAIGLVFYLLVGGRVYCSWVCPVGAFYGLLGEVALVRVGALQRERCDDCLDCFAVCPEHQVIKPALKGADQGLGPVILSGHCTNCGRCIDVCGRDVFAFTTRFANNHRLANNTRPTNPSRTAINTRPVNAGDNHPQEVSS
jgi:polyferredoxin